MYRSPANYERLQFSIPVNVAGLDKLSPHSPGCVCHEFGSVSKNANVALSILHLTLDELCKLGLHVKHYHFKLYMFYSSHWTLEIYLNEFP